MKKLINQVIDQLNLIIKSLILKCEMDQLIMKVIQLIVNIVVSNPLRSFIIVQWDAPTALMKVKKIVQFLKGN